MTAESGLISADLPAHPRTRSQLTRRYLHDGWTLSAIAGPAESSRVSNVPAVVPGLVHTDLLRAGLIDDPFDGDNEGALQWIGDTDWEYRTSFDWLPGGFARYDLVAEGLDTVATIAVNGVVVGRTQNQHRSYRFDLRGVLRPGANSLVVTFTAPVPEVERRARDRGALPHVNHHPYNTLRKSASNFGWDWGIDVATSGIWKPIALESWSGVRIASVRHIADAPNGDGGSLATSVQLERDGESEAGMVVVRMAASDRATEVVVDLGSDLAQLDLECPGASLWWPRGHGAQPLYDVVVTVEADDFVDEHRSRVGFRRVSLNTTPDASDPTDPNRDMGTPFELSINGALIQVRGANWIPDHAFVTEVDRARYARRITDATDAHMNLLRVWGGGIYESDDFYDLCDEAGVLVWQDFLFACAAYSEEEWLADEVRAEAVEHIVRLSPHPSLVLWNGNNESTWLRIDQGWRSALVGKAWGDGYYRSLLPNLLAELDPSRPYSPSSPYSFDDYLHPNDSHNGTMHVWDVWNTRDYAHYRDYHPRFVSEFGFQGPPAWSTLTSVVHDEPLDPYGAHMLIHQKATDGNLKLELGMRAHLPDPLTIDDWHWATQLNQAHAIRFGIEHFRSLWPHNSGTIVWQLNDNWPVISWAAVDSHEHRKPLWHAIRQSYSPSLATIQPSENGLGLVLVRDESSSWAGTAVMRRLSFDGRELASATADVMVEARASATVSIPEHLARPADASGETLVIELGGGGFGRAIWNFAEVRGQALDPAPWDARATRESYGYRVEVTARSFVRDLFLQADRVDPSARVDIGMISLIAGETASFEVVSGIDCDPAAFLDPLVLRAANDLLGEK